MEFSRIPVLVVSLIGESLMMSLAWERLACFLGIEDLNTDERLSALMGAFADHYDLEEVE